MKHAKGFALMEALLASVIIGLIFLSIAQYQKKFAENKVKNDETAQIIGLVTQINKYSNSNLINGSVNPLLLGKKISTYQSKDLNWLKLNSCPKGMLPTNGTLLNEHFIKCDLIADYDSLSYIGTRFNFVLSGVTVKNKSRRKVRNTESYFMYTGNQIEKIGDLASRILEHKNVGIVFDVNIAILTPKSKLNKEYIVGSKIKYKDFIGISGTRERFLKARPKKGVVAIAISTQYSDKQALMRDGSVSLTKTAGLCWDPAQGASTPCISVDYNNNKSELNFSNFDFVKFKTGQKESRTPVIAGYYTFPAGGLEQEIDMIDCPANYHNKFSAVVSSFSSAGPNADFTKESYKVSKGTVLATGEHALVSGISLDWTQGNNKKWKISADIGIEGGVLPKKNKGNNSLLHNPRSLSFIGFQWCQS